MLEQFVDKLLSLSGIRTENINGVNYTKDTLSIVHPPEHISPKVLQFRTLEGLAGFIKEDIDPDRIGNEHLFLHVADFNYVRLFGGIDPKNENKRFLYASAELDAKSYQFGDRNWLDIEMFVIALQSMFLPTDQVNSIIAMLGNMANEAIQTNKDDGFSQTIQISSGITTKSKVKVENPVILQPYRTFREVEQPASNCILRFKKSGNGNGIQCALFESDGGAWKLEAITNIKEWFQDNMSDVIVIG